MSNKESFFEILGSDNIPIKFWLLCFAYPNRFHSIAISEIRPHICTTLRDYGVHFDDIMSSIETLTQDGFLHSNAHLESIYDFAITQKGAYELESFLIQFHDIFFARDDDNDKWMKKFEKVKIEPFKNIKTTEDLLNFWFKCKDQTNGNVEDNFFDRICSVVKVNAIPMLKLLGQSLSIKAINELF